MGRSEKQYSLLRKLLDDYRQKRGLFNVVGSVSNTLFGTLTGSDLEYVHSELEKLHKHNRVLAFSISNQTQVVRALLNSASYNADTLMEHSKKNVERFN